MHVMNREHAFGAVLFHMQAVYWYKKIVSGYLKGKTMSQVAKNLTENYINLGKKLHPLYWFDNGTLPQSLYCEYVWFSPNGNTL
jgi:hypothetical protein